LKNIKKKCGVVLFLGLPNAGKSTLLNTIIKKKISIVSPKVQTTKDQISGILTRGDVQIIFTDTPGIIENKRFFNKHYSRMIVNKEFEIDLNCLVIDLKRDINKKEMSIFSLLLKRFKRNILVLNKIDLVKKERLLEISNLLNSKFNFIETFMISAKKKKGIEFLIKKLINNIPNREWIFNEGIHTDKNINYQISEITREKIFKLLNKEIPYSVKIVTEIENNEKIATVKQLIIVKKKSQKSIIIGKNGEKIKMIGTKSRIDIEKLLEKKIFLDLIVKTKD